MTTIANDMPVNANAETIYAAIATEAGIRAWWAKDSDVAADVGGEHELRFQKGDRAVTMRFRVDELERNTKVRWTCTSNDNPVWVGTTLTWTIDGATLRFAHEGFAEDQSPPYKMTVDGWQHFFASLKSYVETGEGQPA